VDEKRELFKLRELIPHGLRMLDLTHTFLNNSKASTISFLARSLLLHIAKELVVWLYMPRNRLWPQQVMIVLGRFGTWRTKRTS
jgi:hypothetical protein